MARQVLDHPAKAPRRRRQRLRVLQLIAPANRMPAILAPECEAPWLDPDVRDPVAALACLRPYPAGLMACDRVDPRVGSPLNDDPERVAPLVGRRLT